MWPEKNRFKGEFNFNLSYFLNPSSESAPKLKDPVKSYENCKISAKKASILTGIHLDHSTVELGEN